MEIKPRSIKEVRDSNQGFADVRMTVVMSLAMSASLAAEAARLGTSASEIIRELVRVYLEGQK